MKKEYGHAWVNKTWFLSSTYYAQFWTTETDEEMRACWSMETVEIATVHSYVTIIPHTQNYILKKKNSESLASEKARSSFVEFCKYAIHNDDDGWIDTRYHIHNCNGGGVQDKYDGPSKQDGWLLLLRLLRRSLLHDWGLPSRSQQPRVLLQEGPSSCHLLRSLPHSTTLSSWRERRWIWKT